MNPTLVDRALTQRIGRRINRRRRENNMSLAQLSDAMDNALSKSRISNYEQGIRRPSIEVAQILAKALGVNTTWILCFDAEDEQ